MEITDFLTEGERDAISLENLAISTGLSERAVRQEVLNARLKGELIISTENGYFLPKSTDEIKSYVFTRKAYLKTANAALRPFIKALKG